LKRKAPDVAANNVTFHPMPSAPENIIWEEEIQFDPGKRKKIIAYHSSIRDIVRRKYLVNGPGLLRTLNFPSTRIGDKKNRRFNYYRPCLVPKFFCIIPITSNLRHMHGALNAVEKITNYTV